MWLRLTASATASELERIVAGQRQVDDKDAADAFKQRRVSRRSLGGGRTRIVIDVPDDAAEIVWAAIDLRSETSIDDAIGDATIDGQRPRPSAVIAERGGRAAVRADAVTAIAADAIEAAPDPGDRDRNHSLGHLTLVAELDADGEDLTSGQIDLAVRLSSTTTSSTKAHTPSPATRHKAASSSCTRLAMLLPAGSNHAPRPIG